MYRENENPTALAEQLGERVVVQDLDVVVPDLVCTQPQPHSSNGSGRGTRRCGSFLRRHEQRDGVLVCGNGHSFESRDGIPDMSPGDPNTTVDAFTYKWNYAPEAMRAERERIATEWFFERFESFFLEEGGIEGKKRVLDAGCGLGNLTRALAAEAPQATVFGLDLSESLYHVCELPENARLVRGDLTACPISGKFDLIVSDGVLHHTESTRRSLQALIDLLEPTGDLLVYLYRRKAPLRELADDYLRKLLTRMSPGDCMSICEQFADIGRQLREAKVTLHFDKPIPVLGIAAGEHDLQRLIYWHFFNCWYDDGGDMVASALENFDWYAPPLAHRHLRSEVEGWLTLNNWPVEIVRFGESESGFSIHIRRTHA